MVYGIEVAEVGQRINVVKVGRRIKFVKFGRQIGISSVMKVGRRIGISVWTRHTVFFDLCGRIRHPRGCERQM